MTYEYLGEWLRLVPAVLAALAVLVGPGLAVVAATTRLRTWTVGIVPAVGVGVIGVGGIVFDLIGVRWGLWPLVAFTAAVAAIAFTVRRLVRADGGGEAPVGRSGWLWIAGGTLVGGGLAALQIVRGLIHPSTISQTFDSLFHLNAVQHVLHSGSGTSLTLAGFTGDAPYPMGWHNVVAQVVNITGLAIPEAVNATNLAIAGVVWPLGCAALVATMLPHRRWVAGVAAVVSAGFAAFPLLPLQFGVLYPNFLAVALLGGGLAGLIRIYGLPRSEPRLTRGELTVRVLLMLVAVGGIGLAQPNAMMMLIATMVPLTLWAAGAAARTAFGAGNARRGWALLGAALFGVAVIAVVWQFVRPPQEAAGWPRHHWPGQALGLVLTGSLPSGRTAWAVVILMAAGVVALVRRPRNLWMASPFVMAALIYTAASSWVVGSGLRMYVSGVFFNDAMRIAAFLPLGSVVLAALGAERTIDWLRQLIGRVPGDIARGRIRLWGAAALGLVLVYGVGFVNPGLAERVTVFRSYHAPGHLLTHDERALLERLADYTADDALIAGNPMTGAALAFALGGRTVTEAHGYNDASQDVRYIAAHLDDITTNPRVCEAIQREGVGYVLDFGTDSVLPWDPTGFDYSGFDDVRPNAYLELLAREGQAELFRVNC